MMFFTDENHYCRGIWEMAKTNTFMVLRYSEIFLPFQREKTMIMMVLLLRKASINRNAVEIIDMGEACDSLIG
ncbi:MAG: hypothetical protein AB2L14_12285 [Candidatus Xenobiia bacterium LiM19]